MENKSRLVQQIDSLKSKLCLVQKERDEARARIELLSQELSAARLSRQHRELLSESKLYTYQAKFQRHLGITEAEQFEKLKKRIPRPVLLEP